MRFFNTEDPVQSDRHLLFAAPASSGQWRPRSGAGIRHWFRADPLGKSSQNQNDFCAGVVGTGPDGTRKDIKHGTAFPATIIQDRHTVAHRGTLSCRQEMPL